MKVVCYQTAECLQSFAECFSTLINSAIFNSIWSTMKCAHRSNPDMTISDVGPRMWEPTFAQCQQLLEELNSASITLASVDKNLKEYRMEKNKLENELYVLSSGVSKCLQVPSNFAWIRSIVDRIQQYWRLCDHREAANSFLRLRDALNLTGDFRDVEGISKEVIYFSVYYAMDVNCDYVTTVIYYAYVCSTILLCR